MSDIPYLPLYVNDYEGDTAHLSFDEDGAYSRLIRLCWRTPTCSLPNDPKWIMKRMRASQEEYDILIKPIINDYFTIKKGRIFQKRLQQEFLQISAKIKAQKLNGKKGGVAKALNNKKNKPNHTKVSPLAKSKPNPSNQNQNQNYIKTKKDIQKKFDDFWKVYPKRQGGNPKQPAMDKFVVLCKTISPDEIIEGARKYALQEAKNKDRQFIAQAVTWLNQSRWMDDYILPIKKHLESAADYGAEETDEIVATHYDKNQILEMLDD